ncbi:unnamed protein product [Effrenium voratum]|nr:unnamed protein product [Effrenium voratum]
MAAVAQQTDTAACGSSHLSLDEVSACDRQLPGCALSSLESLILVADQFHRRGSIESKECLAAARVDRKPRLKTGLKPSPKGDASIPSHRAKRSERRRDESFEDVPRSGLLSTVVPDTSRASQRMATPGLFEGGGAGMLIRQSLRAKGNSILLKLPDPEARDTNGNAAELVQNVAPTLLQRPAVEACVLTVMQIDIADHVFDECRWNNKCGSDSIAVSFTRRERATIGHRSCRGPIGTFARGAAGEERGYVGG